MDKMIRKNSGSSIGSSQGTNKYGGSNYTASTQPGSMGGNI